VIRLVQRGWYNIKLSQNHFQVGFSGGNERNNICHLNLELGILIKVLFQKNTYLKRFIQGRFFPVDDKNKKNMVNRFGGSLS